VTRSPTRLLLSLEALRGVVLRGVILGVDMLVDVPGLLSLFDSFYLFLSY